MSNLTGLNASLIQLHNDLMRELELTSESKRQMAIALETVREALAEVDKIIMEALDERLRAVAAAIGTDAPADVIPVTAKRRIA